MRAFADTPARALQRFTPDPDAAYSIETIAHLAGVQRHTVLLCCRHRLISPIQDPDYGGYRFEVGAIQTLQRVEYLYRECGINFVGIRIILGLMDEVEHLRALTRNG
jgi:DNA-binding transcriptional MerR regulator